MFTGGSGRALLRYPRLAALATRECPAWLWSADGSRILWANATGAAIFGAATVDACAQKRFHDSELAAAQVIRLAAMLPAGGQERLERLRGFGARLGGFLVCACSRIVADDGKAAVLIAATEAAGPALPLAERVRRLFADNAEPVAAFLPDGRLLFANAEGERWFGGTTLDALGLDKLVAATLREGGGSASAIAPLSGESVEVVGTRLGQDSAGQGARSVLLFTIEPGTGVKPAVKDVGRPPLEIPAPTGDGSTSALASSTSAPALAPQSRAAGGSASTPERRHPLRFVWEMDADNRFRIASDEFVQRVGPAATLFGRPWHEIAAALELDPADRVIRAIASRETWSGITVSWPVPSDDQQQTLRMPVELSGLPVFDRDRIFRGYRGFGVCRDLGQIDGLAHRSDQEAPRVGVSMPAPAGTPPVPLADTMAPAPADEPREQKTSDAAPMPASATPEFDPALANVVPFRPSSATESKAAPGLSAIERRAFRELAQELTSRLRGGHTAAPVEIAAEDPAATAAAQTGREEPNQDLSQAVRQAMSAKTREKPSEPSDPSEPGGIAEATGDPLAGARPSEAAPDAAAAPFDAIAEHALLDRIPIGVLVYRHDKLLYANRHFLDLSGYGDLAAIEAAGGLSSLIADPGTVDVPADAAGTQALAIISRGGDKLPVEGRMIKVPWSGSPAIALILTKAAAATETAGPIEQPRASESAPASAIPPAEFVAKINHEIRNPLTAITGFAEAMMTERFGPIGNEHYREYIKDIHAAGTHLTSMLNDLFDLSRVETSGVDLTFVNVNLNELTQGCVAMMQPQANRARIIIRTALTIGLPPVIADERALRQIVLGLLSNSIRLTGPGGQIIVSTVFSDAQEAVLRVRDTGSGMSQKDIEAALEPFRGLDTSVSLGSPPAGFSLPLTKALAEANHAHFSIKSAPEAGTLIEIAFPSNRLVAA
jgi:signal transduction histidine kinase